MSAPDTNQLKLHDVGRLAFRVEGDWWVAYWALPDKMEGALELARVQLAIVHGHPWRKSQFMKMLEHFIKEMFPGVQAFDVKQAPEHERAGGG